MTDRFARLRHGLLDHLPQLSDPELRVFITLLIGAEFGGADKGVFLGGQRDIAGLSGATIGRTNRGMQRLIERGWVAKEGPARYRILKYDASERSEKCSTGGTPDLEKCSTGGTQRSKKRSTGGTPCSTAGTLCSTGGTPTPYIGFLDIDLYIELDRFAALYPKRTRVEEALAAGRELAAEDPGFGERLPRILAAAELLAQRTPAASVQYLPSMLDFLEHRWADDWQAWLFRENAKNPAQATQPVAAGAARRRGCPGCDYTGWHQGPAGVVRCERLEAEPAPAVSPRRSNVVELSSRIAGLALEKAL